MEGMVGMTLFRLKLVRFTAVSLLGSVLLAGCNPTQHKPVVLPQWGYLWQREWTPAVDASVFEARKQMDGLVILGAEVEWTGNQAHVVKANINWELLKSAGVPCSIALRIAPNFGLFAADDSTTRLLSAKAKSLVDVAASNGIRLRELQIDFDCAEKDLAGYRVWIRAIRQSVHPLPLVVTTLPAWLNNPEFGPLVRESDAFVLQVHSVRGSKADAPARLCDVASARAWVRKATRFRVPFSVALPTYSCSAGYNAEGKLISLAMDSVQPSWPPNTRVLEFSTDPDEMAMLVKEWQEMRPAELREIIWYRVPVATDLRNWRWPTLSAVMSGRKPVHRLEILQEGENPVDLSIRNTGEADEQLNSAVAATCNASSVIAADALPGWTVHVTSNQAIFTAAPEHRMRLPPGAKRQIGWLRYDRPPGPELKLAGNL